MDVSSIARRLLHTGALLATFAALAACGGGGGGSTNDLASLASLPRDAASASDPGSLGEDFLRSGDFDALTIEVDYPAGRPPSEDAIDLLVRRLGAYCRKPGGIVVVLDDALPAEAFGDALDGDGLRGLERVWRDRYADAATGEAVLYLLCVPGAHAADTASTRVLGLSYGGSSCALFLDATDRGADVYATTAETQGTILVHEACHLLGLVNNGLEMVVPHEDPKHVHHCTDAACLLTAAPRVPRLGPNLGDPDFAPLCPHCLADLARAAGN